MIRKEEITEVGIFRKTHALKGELNMILEIDPQYFTEGNPLIVELEGIFVPFFVETIRPKGTTSFLVKLKGVDSESEAADFVNKDIYIKSEDAEEFIEDDNEIYELKDFQAYDEYGDLLGKIIDIEDSTANILFIIENDAQETLYVPANQDLIKDIDYENKKIHMVLPDGLKEMNL